MDTFVILIKPGFQEVGSVVTHLLTSNGLEIISKKANCMMTRSEAEQFYAVHAQRPFYKELVSYMTESEITILIVRGSIDRTRNLIGSTDPKSATAGTIRALYGRDVQRNVIHCSDSSEAAKQELLALGYASVLSD